MDTNGLCDRIKDVDSPIFMYITVSLRMTKRYEPAAAHFCLCRVSVPRLGFEPLTTSIRNYTYTHRPQYSVLPLGYGACYLLPSSHPLRTNLAFHHRANPQIGHNFPTACPIQKRTTPLRFLHKNGCDQLYSILCAADGNFFKIPIQPPLKAPHQI